MMRVGLLLGTNFAILIVAGIIMSLLGLDQSTNTSLMGMLVFCSLFGFGGSFVSLLISKWMAKRSSKAHIIETPANETEQWLVDRVAALAAQAGIGMPEVGIFPSNQPNAFATGWNKNKSLVAVSSGMLNTFPRDEVEAVMAHEIGHVANGDMITLTLIQGITNTFVLFFSRLLAFAISAAARNRSIGRLGYYVGVFVGQIVFGFLASLLVMWFSRRREFRADHSAAQLTTPGAMARALERLKSPPPSQGDDLAQGMAAFGISSQFKGRLGGLLSTHPPLDDRIAALQQQG